MICTVTRNWRFQEHRNCGLVSARWPSLAWKCRRASGRPAWWAFWKARPGPTVLLRFDMDALPINEETGLTYKSEVAGKMIPGHDAHRHQVGFATLLASRQDDLPGRVKFMFQPPAEEIAGGCAAMIRRRRPGNPCTRCCFRPARLSMTAVGQAVVKGGPLWASADKPDVEITGRAHGGCRTRGVDAIVVAAHAITQQTVVSRSIDPLEPAVLSVGEISGSAFNVIAERVMFSGTLRDLRSGRA